MDRICIFARVSTSIQEYDRQVNELTTLAQRNSWSVEAIFCEKVSGAKRNADRKELSRMVDYVLYIQNYGIETLTESGEVNPMSQFLITILAEVARMERKTIRERVESGYKNFRANGGKVGRKEGYRKSEADMREQYAEEIRLLRKGISLRNIAKITGTSVNTIRKCQTLI